VKVKLEARVGLKEEGADWDKVQQLWWKQNQKPVVE